MDGQVLALAGGTGGAKLVLGLASLLPARQLVIVVNTGDDQAFHGLHVSPDLDTIMYTLSGLVNRETGWGLSGDTFNALEMLRRYDAETWFNLGDHDLATHVRRTELLARGDTLSQVTEGLCRQLGVKHQVVPMSDQPVRTVLSTDGGDLAMQTYFVRQRCEPEVRDIAYVGAASAEVAPRFAAAMDLARTVVFCPSNPYLSIGPILAIPGVRRRIAELRPPQLRVAVSPIVGGAAVRGPAAKIMAELGHEVSCVGVARIYQDLCDVLVIDQQDAHRALEIQRMGLKPLVAATIMNTESDKIALARRILQLTGN